MTRSRRSAWTAAAVLLGCVAVRAQEITRTDLRWEDSYPLGIAAAPDGTVWYTDWNGIGRIDAGGTFTKVYLSSSATGLGALTLGGDGSLWFTEWSPPAIGRLTPEGATSAFPLPATMQIGLDQRIASGPDQNLWLTDPVGDTIVRITPSGVVTPFGLPRVSAGLAGIAAGADGNVWFTEKNADRIGRITPAGVISEFELPTGSGPAGIARGADGAMWFAEARAKRIGRIGPSGGITELPVPESSTDLLVAPDGHLWLLGVDGRLRRLSASGAVTEFDHVFSPRPNAMAMGIDGAIWLTSGNGWDFPPVIYRFAVMTGDCIADPRTLCLNGGRFRVTTDFRTKEGASGSGRASTLTADSGTFWFFDPASVEVVVKLLNGCSGNGRYWVFGAGLTNVEVTTRVTDTHTGLTREYTNPQQTPFAPIQDTAAFQSCP